MIVAALFVEKGGCYFDLEGVEPYDLKRDAMKYAGPHPVVAHPPCARWCRLAGLVEKRWGHKRGDDGGTFAFALAAVRQWGGVLEHPAYSDAFNAYGLPIPSDKGGWQMGLCGGWVCHVEQNRYGHVAKKATWLYAFGVEPLPSMRWGHVPDVDVKALVSWCGNRVKSGEVRPRVGKAAAAAAATPIPFRDELLGLARSVRHRGKDGERVVEDMSKRQRSATPPSSEMCCSTSRERRGAE